MRVLALSVFALACTPPKSTKQKPGGTVDSAVPDSGDSALPADTSETAETGDSTETADTGTPDAVSTCTAPIPFDDGAGGTDIKDLAADFTLPTTAGDWNFKENWTGCDSYVFLFYHPTSSDDVDLWGSSVTSLLDASPENVEYFFLSTRGSDDSAATDVATMQASVDAALARLDTDTAAAWQGRFHYVPTSTKHLDSWVADMASGATADEFAIDRMQHIRLIGMLGKIRGDGTVKSSLAYLANESVHYNFEADREASLESEPGVTVIPVWDQVEMSDTGWAGITTPADVVFPDAATMAGFDTLEADLTMDCKDRRGGHAADIRWRWSTTS